jgi:hypothetical protein
MGFQREVPCVEQMDLSIRDVAVECLGAGGDEDCVVLPGRHHLASRLYPDPRKIWLQLLRQQIVDLPRSRLKNERTPRIYAIVDPVLGPVSCRGQALLRKLREAKALFLASWHIALFAKCGHDTRYRKGMMANNSLERTLEPARAG